jgi:hypothetical protein
MVDIESQCDKYAPLFNNFGSARRNIMEEVTRDEDATHPTENKENSSGSTHWSPRRINKISDQLKSRSYLEIGVHEGLTFKNVNVNSRVAVDPNFAFDITNYKNENTSFERLTSDSFFSQLAISNKFDFIFIDGLHTFEQTYRDLCNVFLHWHAGSVILIDDTLPDDVYSALSNHALAIKFRLEAGGVGQSWHGDVFKTIFALHDFHPGLNYRTITGSGNPQTLIWQSKSNSARTPLFNSLEKISRLTYFDLMNNVDVMKTCSEDDAINTLVTEMTNH